MSLHAVHETTLQQASKGLRAKDYPALALAVGTLAKQVETKPGVLTPLIFFAERLGASPDFVYQSIEALRRAATVAPQESDNEKQATRLFVRRTDSLGAPIIRATVYLNAVSQTVENTPFRQTALDGLIRQVKALPEEEASIGATLLAGAALLAPRDSEQEQKAYTNLKERALMMEPHDRLNLFFKSALLSPRSSLIEKQFVDNFTRETNALAHSFESLVVFYEAAGQAAPRTYLKEQSLLGMKRHTDDLQRTDRLHAILKAASLADTDTTTERQIIKDFFECVEEVLPENEASARIAQVSRRPHLNKALAREAALWVKQNSEEPEPLLPAPEGSKKAAALAQTLE